jgi:hypothetical protein
MEGSRLGPSRKKGLPEGFVYYPCRARLAPVRYTEGWPLTIPSPCPSPFSKQKIRFFFFYPSHTGSMRLESVSIERVEISQGGPGA